MIYFAFAVLLWELCFEPELIKRPERIQIAGIGILFALVDLFTIGIVAARAPLTLYSYAMRKGNYAAGTVLGGISWDPHFTDLRVAITDPNSDDYSDLDLAVQPDNWVYKAAILESPLGCDLTPIGGDSIFFARESGSGGADTVTATRLGKGVDAHDSLGYAYGTPFATKGGYRLRCGKLPADFTIKLVFALISPNPTLNSMPAIPSGTWGLRVDEIAAGSEFDTLDDRPSPSTVTLNGKYVRILKPHTITSTIPVKDGN